MNELPGRTRYLRALTLAPTIHLMSFDSSAFTRIYPRFERTPGASIFASTASILESSRFQRDSGPDLRRGPADSACGKLRAMWLWDEHARDLLLRIPPAGASLCH